MTVDSWIRIYCFYNRLTSSVYFKSIYQMSSVPNVMISSHTKCTRGSIFRTYPIDYINVTSSSTTSTVFVDQLAALFTVDVTGVLPTVVAVLFIIDVVGDNISEKKNTIIKQCWINWQHRIPEITLNWDYTQNTWDNTQLRQHSAETTLRIPEITLNWDNTQYTWDNTQLRQHSECLR